MEVAVSDSLLEKRDMWLDREPANVCRWDT